LVGEILIALALGGIATFLFGPLKKWIETLVDKLFYKDRYDYRQVIRIFNTSLSLVKNSTDVSRLIVGTLVDALNLIGCCLFIKTQSDSLEVSAAQGVFIDNELQQKLISLLNRRNKDIEFPLSASKIDPNIAYIIPLTAAEKEIGILCLSPKTSRQGFTSDDMYLLQGIASTAAIALRSATLVREVDIRNNFISIASHELRTPMTAIMGYADLLLKRDPPTDIRKQWLTNILDSSKNVAAMVDDLLNVARIQSGRLDMKLERVKLSDILTERSTMIRQDISNHEITLEIEPGLPDMLADRDKLSHVIGNLLDNAIKYSPKGGNIILSAKNDTQGDRILISVADEGIGISPEDQASLFTTFHRVHREETHGIQGSGLGLYIVKEWVEAMGGEVWLESKLNSGSTFFIAIPNQDSMDKNTNTSSARSGEERDQKVIDSGRRRKNP
jgi:signal transduction histidine kinase